jgi:hypothetical protein
MLRFRPANASRPRAVVCGALTLFVGVQLALALFLTRTRPEVRDPEYGSLLNALEARIAEYPNRPLVLILGSSRSANLFRPLPPGPGPDPLLFNFATLKTGPLRELQMLNRLLARGVRPCGLVVEVWPPYLTHRGGFTEEPHIGDRDLQPADRAVVARYFVYPGPAYSKLVERVLAPAYSLRFQLLEAYSPFRDVPRPRLASDWDDPSLRTVEGFGWLPAPVPDPEMLRIATAIYTESAREVLGDFRVSPVADAALRDLLGTCSRLGVRTTVVLLPEHSAVRACYPPATQAAVKAYLMELTREYGVPVIDARDWVRDDDFFDSRHTLPHAAAPFTEHFGREVLRPLLEGRSLDRRLLLGTATSPDLPAPAH